MREYISYISSEMPTLIDYFWYSKKIFFMKNEDDKNKNNDNEDDEDDDDDEDEDDEDSFFW